MWQRVKCEIKCENSLLIGLTFFICIVHSIHFRPVFDADVQFRIYILHFIRCQFHSFALRIV